MSLATGTDGRYEIVRGDHVAGLSDIGRVRQVNEDAMHISATGRLLVVADGIGGRRGGEVASAVAVRTIVERLEITTGIDEGAPRGTSLVQEAVLAAHDGVSRQGRDDPALRGMAAALLAAHISANEVRMCHVGDVRCYYLRDRQLTLLTHDHSVPGALVRDGRLTLEDARVHPARNELTQALGMAEPISPAVTHFLLRDNDTLLICSDGLWGEIRHDELQRLMLGGGTAFQVASRLVDEARSTGGTDNITCIAYTHTRRTDSRTW